MIGARIVTENEITMCTTLIICIKLEINICLSNLALLIYVGCICFYVIMSDQYPACDRKYLSSRGTIFIRFMNL